MPVAKSQSHKKNWGDQVAHGVERKQELGNTNTPLDVAAHIVKKVIGPLNPSSPGRWLEPAVGAGNFYIAALQHFQSCGGDPWVLAQQFDALDIDDQAIAVLKRRLTDIFGWSDSQISTLPIHHTSLVDFTPSAPYDVILTNPPYLSPRNWGKTEEERAQMLSKWQAVVTGVDKRADLFIYFFHWCHRHLADNGRSVFLCSDGWLDAGYGQTLRDEVTSTTYNLDTILVWPWKALFRDDTCPIVTVVRKTATQGTELIVDDRNPLDNDKACYKGGDHAVWSRSLSPQQMKDWFASSTENRRQRLVTSPDLYEQLEKAVQTLGASSVPLSSIATVSSFGWSAQDLQKANIMRATGETGDIAKGSRVLPVFFQTQARVGKPVDYRQFRTTASLSHQAILSAAATDKLSEKIARTGTRTGGTWISQAIDRFPLVFTQDPSDRPVPWVGVSKYLHAQLNEPFAQYADILTAVLTSTPVLLMLDRFLKEGTRKTLRKNENGYAKEIRKSDIDALLVPNFTKWDKATLDAIRAHQAKRGVVSLARLDDASANTEWKAIDALVMSAMGLSEEEQERLQKLATALYWRRMRNTLVYGLVRGIVEDAL